VVSEGSQVAGHGARLGRHGRPLVVGLVSHYAILAGPGEASLLFGQRNRLDAQEGAIAGERVSIHFLDGPKEDDV